MCMWLCRNSCGEIDISKPTKPIIGYKILLKSKKGKYKSLYKRYFWKEGEVNNSSRKNTGVVQSELEAGKIHLGFHFFTNKKDALCIREKLNNEVVVKFSIQPSDFVAFGIWENGERNFVATKAKFISEVSW